MVGTWLAIVNPGAGGRARSRYPRWAAGRLRESLAAEVAFTRHPGDAARIAGEARDRGGLAVVGGDGTIAEVVNAMDLGRQALLVVPGGTGNGLARDLGLRTVDDALAAAENGGERAVDLIRARYTSHGTRRERLVVSTAGIGFVASAASLANGYLKPLGRACYPLAAAVAALRQEAFDAEVSMDRASPRRATLTNVLVNNASHTGGFEACPGAHVADGRLHVIAARAGAAAQLAHGASALARWHGFVTAAPVSGLSVRLRLDAPARLMLDGEIWEDVSQVDLEVAPRALARAVAPADRRS